MMVAKLVAVTLRGMMELAAKEGIYLDVRQKTSRKMLKPALME